WLFPPVSNALLAAGRLWASVHFFSLLSGGGVGMRFPRRCYPCRGQTIKSGGSVEPDLGQPQVARTDSAVVRFSCPLEAFFGQGTILGGRFHLETPPSAPSVHSVGRARDNQKLSTGLRPQSWGLSVVRKNPSQNRLRTLSKISMF